MTFANIRFNSFIKSVKKLNDVNILFFFSLGISSGISLPLLLSTSKALLSESGIDIKIIGALSIIVIPYSFKFVFAPFLDHFKLIYLHNFGRRKSWLMLIQIILIIFIILLGKSIYDLNIRNIFFFGFLTGFLASFQDIVIDAFRIERSYQNNQALLTSFYIYGYRIAILISGGLALSLSNFINPFYLYMLMSSFIFIFGFMMAVIMKEDIYDYDNEQKNITNNIIIDNFIINPFKEIFQRKYIFYILAFIIFFKLSDIFAGSLSTVFLLDIGFSKNEIAFIVKTFGIFATMFGVLAGGLLVKFNNNFKQLLLFALLVQILSNFLFYIQDIVGYNILLLYFVILAENLSGGIGDAILVTYLSSLCNKKFTATQYALFTSCASIARSFISSFSGFVVDYYDWQFFFIFSMIISLPAFYLLKFAYNNK